MADMDKKTKENKDTLMGEVIAPYTKPFVLEDIYCILRILKIV